MPTSDAEMDAIITAQLTLRERSRAVAYLLSVPQAAGTRFEAAGGIVIPWDCHVAFVDAEPTANWGHACRYILINRTTGETRSIDARFPPFHRGDHQHWRIAYRAAGVPDTALLTPE